MATHRVGESPTLRLAESSFKHSKADFPTPRLAESESCRVGESFFDYEYLREFEAKSRTAWKVVKGIYEEPIFAKIPENPPHCNVPLRIWIRNRIRAFCWMLIRNLIWKKFNYFMLNNLHHQCFRSGFTESWSESRYFVESGSLSRLLLIPDPILIPTKIFFCDKII